MSDYSIYVLFDEEQVLSDCRTIINCTDDEEAIGGGAMGGLA